MRRVRLQSSNRRWVPRPVDVDINHTALSNAGPPVAVLCPRMERSDDVVRAGDRFIPSLYPAHDNLHVTQAPNVFMEAIIKVRHSYTAQQFADLHQTSR